MGFAKSDAAASVQDAELTRDEVALLTIDWTPEEEAAAKRRLDFVVMPLLFLGFFVLQLDRGNIANALTDNFLVDVGINQNQYNVGQQLLSTGIVLLEIPSNLLLYRLGPGVWLSSQVVAFGLVSAFQAFQHGYGAFIATRFILGLTESGYIPGCLWTLSTWETAKRVMIFFMGNLSASASSNLLAYGILQMRGVGGKSGWFWLFILMGLVTILAGLTLAVLLPISIYKPRSFLAPKLQIFTDRQLHILRRRVLIDDPNKHRASPHITWAAFKSAFQNKNIYPHLLVILLNAGPLSAFGSYTPFIINGWGFNKLRSNALASVGNWIAVPVSVAWAIVSDKFNIRAQTSIITLFLHFIIQIVNRALTTKSRNAKYAGVVLTQVTNFVPHPLNVAWLLLTCRNSEEKAVGMALAIMMANSGGIYGNQIFRADDKPTYNRAFTICLSLVGGAVIVACFQAWNLRRQRIKRQEQENNLLASQETSAQTPPEKSFEFEDAEGQHRR